MTICVATVTPVVKTRPSRQMKKKKKIPTTRKRGVSVNYIYLYKPTIFVRVQKQTFTVLYILSLSKIPSDITTAGGHSLSTFAKIATYLRTNFYTYIFYPTSVETQISIIYLDKDKR